MPDIILIKNTFKINFEKWLLMMYFLKIKILPEPPYPKLKYKVIQVHLKKKNICIVIFDKAPLNRKYASMPPFTADFYSSSDT